MSADAALVHRAYKSGSLENQESGAEFMFANDALSNGAWDIQDVTTPGKPPDDDTDDDGNDYIYVYDDDAEPLMIKTGVKTGRVWLDHPGISDLKFYTDRKCSQEIKISQQEPYFLTKKYRAGDPPYTGGFIFNNPIYMRAENMASGGYQRSGNLRLMVQPSTTDPRSGVEIYEPEMEVGKMKLTIIAGLGADKHHRAVVDYIKENNAKHYFNWVDRTKADSAYVGYLAKNTNIDGIDPRGGVGWLGGGIHSIQEAMSLGADAVVVGNYAGGHTYPIIGDNYWPTFQDGEIYEGGSWNHLTSHTAANARVGYWRTSISGGGFSHETMFGDIPAAGTSGGMAGLVHEPIRSDGGTSAMGRADVSSEDTVIYLNSGYSSRQLGIFEAALKIGIIPPQHPNSDGWAFRQFDGGNSTALAVASPSGTMFLPTEYGGRHKPGTAAYAIFEAAGDLVGAYIRLDPRKPRVPVP